MGYRIHYQKESGSRRKKLTFARLLVLTFLCFLLFLMLVRTYWPEGAAYIRTKTRESAAAVALDRFAGDLVRGEPLAEAFSDFFSNN